MDRAFSVSVRRDLVNAALEKASTILIRNRKVLENGAKMLLEQETLTDTELKILQQQIPLAASVKT